MVDIQRFSHFYKSSAQDPFHFDADPDPGPRPPLEINGSDPGSQKFPDTMDLDCRIRILNTARHWIYINIYMSNTFIWVNIYKQ